MEELYFVNGSDKGLTWKQLMYWCHKCVSATDQYWDYKDKEWKYPAYHGLGGNMRIDSFFKDFRHCDNDMKYIPGQLRYNCRTREYERTVGRYEPKPYQVTDNFGRIIPSGDIRAAFYKYIPNEADKEVVHRYNGSSRWRYWTSLYDHDRDFRKGPVPGRGGSRKWCGRRYKGDHGGLGNEGRQDSIFRAELRDIKEEYGVDVKYNKGRAQEVWSLYTDWDYFHWHNKGVGWKRTRKKKQWM